MTLTQFKTWLDRQERSFKDGTPSKEQYQAITHKLSNMPKEVSGFNRNFIQTTIKDYCPIAA